uniref:Uncharacterized protein n=1 Tax=Trichobilharzia regenti TaxID=157069 RepID=A0AA85KA22_TRIRE|nr:unnamed protein product [Trichobilharzia regenti]
MMTILVIAVIMLVILGYNNWEKCHHCYNSKPLSYNSNDGRLLKVNQRRWKPNPISDSTYNKRVIVFTLILVVITTTIVLTGNYYYQFILTFATRVLFIVIFGTLAIILVFFLLFVDATQNKPYLGFIFLCYYAIFLALILYILALYVDMYIVVIVWFVGPLVCAVGLLLAYIIKTDLTKTLDGYFGFFLMVYFTGIILAGIFFYRRQEAEGYLLMGISSIILLISLTTIIGQIVFKQGYLSLRDKWPLSVLLLITLIDVMCAMLLSEYYLIQVIRGDLHTPSDDDNNKNMYENTNIGILK